MPTSPIYLDFQATTPVDASVSDEMARLESEEHFGNSASQTHIYGQNAAISAGVGRASVAQLLGCTADRIFFMSGATESCNIATLGVVRASSNYCHFVVTAADHRAVLDPARALSETSCELTILPVDEFGMVIPEEIRGAIQANTLLVSAIFASNEVGTINPIADIAAACREQGVLFHTDATQAVGKIPINVSELPIDLMSFSAHKMYGPKGIGALYVRNDDVRKRIQPLMYGGGHERGLRPGTLPVPLVLGFGKACELCQQLMSEDSERIGRMRDRLWERFQAEIREVVLNGHPTKRLYNNLNVSFLGVPSEAFMIKLRDVVAVSAGSACTSANPEPSHVLKAMSVGHQRLESAIRFGLGRFNTMEEIEYVADHVRDAVAELRRHL